MQSWSRFTPVENRKRLLKIVTYADAKQVKEYRLSYDFNNSFRADILSAIQECGRDDFCFRPTSFEWEGGGINGISSSSEGNTVNYFYHMFEGNDRRIETQGVFSDFNGDGIVDFSRATFVDSGNHNLRSVSHGNGTGFSNAGYSLPNYIWFSADEFGEIRSEGIVVDINGDGIPDYTQGTKWSDGVKKLKVYHGTGKSSGARFIDSGYSLPAQVYYNKKGAIDGRQEGLLVDFNGDGRLDYIYGACSDGTTFCNALKIWLHNGNGFTLQTYRLPKRLFRKESGSSKFRGVPEGILVDFNGDGWLDFSTATRYKEGGGDLTVYNGSATGFKPAGYILPDKVYFNFGDEYKVKTEAVIQDINGDGLPDFATGTKWTDENRKDLKVYYGTGEGFTAAGYDLPGELFENKATGSIFRQKAELRDMNGDGRMDFVYGSCSGNGASCSALKIHYNTGKGFVQNGSLPARLFRPGSDYKSYPEGLLLDFDGDGLPDFSRATQYIDGNSHRQRHLNKNTGAPILAKITEGRGRVREITYMRLNDKSNNAKTGEKIYERSQPVVNQSSQANRRRWNIPP